MSLSFFFKPRPAWRISRFGALPQLPGDLEPSMRDHLVVAGGLALVLSRCPPDRLEYLFPHALQLYRALQGDPAAIAPELVSDASHEVAQCTDQSTRDAMRRLMRANARALPAIPATA